MYGDGCTYIIITTECAYVSINNYDIETNRIVIRSYANIYVVTLILLKFFRHINHTSQINWLACAWFLKVTFMRM